MEKIALNSVNERAMHGYTHRIKVLSTDLTAAATTQTLSLITGMRKGHIVKDAALVLQTPFVGPSITNLTVDVGFDGASVDDADAFIDLVELASAGTEILACDGNGAAFATLRTGHAFVEAATITALFTATGANLSVLTAGEVWIYLNVVDLIEVK